MKKIKIKFCSIYLVPFFLFVLYISACSGGAEGNKLEVKIGSQTWTATNLDVSTFRNGEPIPEAKSFADWKNAIKEKKPAFCYFEFKPENGSKFGKLYNSYAINDPRGLAPEGWKIPSELEWDELESEVVKLYQSDAGPHLKAKKVWDVIPGASTTPATNESGFNSIPSPYIFSEYPNEFGMLIGEDGFSTKYQNYASATWWCAGGLSYVSLQHKTDRLGGSGAPLGQGHAVRCVKK